MTFVSADWQAQARGIWQYYRYIAASVALWTVVATGTAIIILYFNYNSIDFLSYWAAGTLAIHGNPALAYDIGAHNAIERTAAPIKGLLPFPYPPPFLLFLLPFSLFPFWIAFPLWVVVTGGLYVLTARRIAPLPYSLAQPCVLSNSLIGQNAFLTSAIFISGTELLSRRPFSAGAILGLLIIKPQLATLLPFVLLAAGAWRAIAGAALSSLGLLTGTLLLFGPPAYEGFVQILPFYTQAMAASRWPWAEIASIFAFARYLGVPQGAALAIHAVVALAAAFLACRAWYLSVAERVPILAAATILIPPYLLTYDALLLIVPLAFLIQQKRRPDAVALIWVTCALPVAGFFGFYDGPNSVPIAAILSLCALHLPWAQLRRSQSETSSNAREVEHSLTRTEQPRV